MTFYKTYSAFDNDAVYYLYSDVHPFSFLKARSSFCAALCAAYVARSDGLAPQFASTLLPV